MGCKSIKELRLRVNEYMAYLIPNATNDIKRDDS